MKTFYQVEFNEPNKVTVSINDGLRLVLVLRSRLIVWKYNEKYEYQKGDIFIVNHREQFRFIENKDTLYISIHLTESYLKQYIDDYNNKILILEKGCLQEVIYKQIVNAIAMIGVVNIRKGEYYRLYIEQQLINLMFIIVRFLPTKMNESYKTMLNDYRVEFVCNYIQSNYTNDISLTKVAKKVALSTTYLSKIFTQQMGMGFNQYLIHIRLEHCKEDLIYTDNTITQIALKNGFSNSNMLLKHFKKDTQMTPTQYRGEYKDIHLSENQYEENENIAYQIYLHYLSDYINQPVDSAIQSTEAEKVIDVTLKDSKQTLLHYQHVIQIGNLDVLLIQRYRKQLLEVKKCIGLNHVLIKDPIREGFIKDKIIESDEVIPNVHRYMKIDECLNFLLMYHIGLGIEINPPKAISKFKGYYKELVYVLEHIYNTVPDSHLFNLVLYINCIDEQNSQTIITLFKQYFKNIKIVLNFNIENQAEVHIAKRILEDHKQHIDSIAFCANQNDIINFQSIESDQFNLAKKHITLKLKKIMEWLDVKNRKISFTLLNWNTLTGDTNLTNGEYFRAGIIFEQLIEMNGHINMIGYWLNFEIHQKYSQKDIKKELNGIDLYHQFDGKRPAFFTSMFFKKLLKNILYRNGNCIALGNTEHFQIVLWDAEHYNPYFTLNDSSNNLNHKEYQINIFDLLPGTYKIKHLTLDKNHGALYKIWQQYNTQHGMDEETINYVNRVSFPKLDVSEVDIIDTITYHLKLLTNAIQIIEFRRYFDKKYS